jgi:hypothetical protein
MGNGDKVKAAKKRTVNRSVKVAAIQRAGHKAHSTDKQEQAGLTQLRRFEDHGGGHANVTARGRQYEHEEQMRVEKAKREAKAAKAKVFLANIGAFVHADVDNGHDPAAAAAADVDDSGSDDIGQPSDSDDDQVRSSGAAEPTGPSPPASGPPVTG